VATTAADPLPVLVVDDDSALIRTLSDILKLHGYAPATAASGNEGLRMAEARTPALAVVDLGLPDMEGTELAARLHALSELTQVIVLTGNASLESAVAAMRGNSIDYLLKPVQIPQLLAAMNTAGERYQRRSVEQQLAESQQRYRTLYEQQAVVAEFGTRALVADNAALFADAVAVVTKTLDVKHASILERRTEGSQLVLRAGMGWSHDKVNVALVPISDDTVAGRTIRTREPVIVNDLQNDDRFPSSTSLRDRYHVRSAVAVIIPGPVQPYGVLGAFDVQERQFTHDQVHFLQAIAHVLGSAIERERTELQMRQSQRLEAVGQLSGGIAHDFNNMLTAISGYSEIIRAGLPKGHALHEDVDEVLKAAQRAAGLTRQLLAFSRQQVLQPRVLNLNDIVADTEKMLKRVIGENIDMSTDLAADLGLIKADPGQIEQVLLNLCVNARDAMPEGGQITIETQNVRLDLSLARNDVEKTRKPYVMLAVSDTGIGMDAETRARIFEPFFTTKDPEKGTGLGLATVYGIVTQSGGDIWVYSEVGQGTAFKIYLPVVDEQADAVMTGKTAAPKRGTETVLLAEDDPAVRRLAKRVLEDAGYTVLIAANGIEARDAARRHGGPIQLLMTDMIMPGISGAQLAEQLRKENQELRVLYTSGYTDSAVVRRGLVERGSFFLQKPFSAEGLAMKVREVLDANGAVT
jgi:signal transduction histidine kinase/DNA-binding response OmpR family regulator